MALAYIALWSLIYLWTVFGCSEAGTPCKYESYYSLIKCTGTGPEMIEYFRKLSLGETKHFKNVQLSSEFIDELPANAFADIQFDNLDIRNSPSLSRIHRQAFNGTHLTLKKLTMYSPPIIYVNDNTSEYNVFAAINTLKALEYLTLSFTKIREIPDNGIQSLPNLITIQIYGHLQRIGSQAFKDLPKLIHLNLALNDIQQIKSQSFKDLPKLSKLDLHHNDIRIISDNAFAFNGNKSEKILTIDLTENKLGVTSVAAKVFEGIKQPVYLKLKDNLFGYINQTVFEGFLSEHKFHKIFSRTNCMNKQNDWLRQKYPFQWIDDNC